jgi:hypothetical protein
MYVSMQYMSPTEILVVVKVVDPKDGKLHLILQESYSTLDECFEVVQGIREVWSPRTKREQEKYNGKNSTTDNQRPHAA